MIPTLITLGLLFLIVTCVGAGVQIGLHARLRPPRPKPTPKAARRHPHADTPVGHAIPRAPDPVIVIPPVDVRYQPGQVKPDYGDETEVRTRPYDLTIVASPEAARRARGWES